MDPSFFRYDEPYGRPQRKTNLFGWTIAILILSGLTLAAWLGSYYIFGQPERPDSYRILQKLHKIEEPKRFQLTAAPPGEFLNSKQLFERYSALRPAELARKNAELTRNYIRNFQQMAGSVPYVTGRYTIMETHQLGAGDLFPSGVTALTTAVEYGELLLEHIYPADAQAVPLMKETLVTGLEMKLDRGHDLSAVVHAERLSDGRLLITAVPLLYGSYTVTQGRGSFSLEPPLALNMAAGWPIFKQALRRKAEMRFAEYRQKAAPTGQQVPLPGLNLTPTPPSAANELVRVEAAEPVQTPSPKPAAALAKASPTPKSGKVAKNEKPSPTPAALAAATPGSSASVIPKAQPVVAEASPAPTVAALAALPVTGDTTLASTAGGGTWKTYPAGKMPAGRLITTSDLDDVAQRGLAGERVYLRGEFVVNFAESHRAVLRPKNKISDSVLRLGAPSSTRIVVEFPTGVTPPAQGATVARDQARPYEITEVRKQSDGQLNVFVREIMQ